MFRASVVTHPFGEDRYSAKVPTGEGKDSWYPVKCRYKCIYPRLFRRYKSGSKVKKIRSHVGTEGSSPLPVNSVATGLQTTLFRAPTPQQVTVHNQRIYKSSEGRRSGPNHRGFIAEKDHRTSQGQEFLELLQSSFLSFQTRQSLEASDRPQRAQQIPGYPQILETPESIRASIRKGE